MNEIIDLANKLTKLRSDANIIKETLKPVQEEVDKIQSELMSKMREYELKSIKTNTHNFSRTIKKDMKVFNSNLVIEELKKRNEYQNYVIEQLDTIAVKSYAKSLLKETGEVLNGMEPTETEYISIKTNA